MYRQFGYWHTWVRHSRKKDPKTGEWLPVQFTVRKKIKLKSGEVAWRKGGAQKKDGFFGLLRKHVSRRAIPTIERETVRGMCYFYQWVYWRTRDPEQDALRGHHDRHEPPVFDLLKEFGRLRLRLRDMLGDDALRHPCWLERAEKLIFRDLPRPRMAHKPVRLSQKTAPPSPDLGARARKPAVGGWTRKRKH